jgi:hypothetical protein
VDLPAVFLVDVRFPDEAGAAGAALAGVVLELAGAAGVAAAGALAGAASAAAALDFLRLFLAVDAAGAAVSAGLVRRGSSFFFGSGLFLLCLFFGLLSGGGIRAGVGRTRLPLGQSRRNSDREHQTKGEHPSSDFILEAIHIYSHLS